MTVDRGTGAKLRQPLGTYPATRCARSPAVLSLPLASNPTPVDRFLYTKRCFDHALMLSDSDAEPACLTQTSVGPAITLTVCDHLRPVAGIGGDDGVVFRTAMPEAAVQEHCNPCRRKYPISGAAQLLERSGEHPVPQAQSMHRRPQRNFGFVVAPAVGPHARPRTIRGGPGISHEEMVGGTPCANSLSQVGFNVLTQPDAFADEPSGFVEKSANRRSKGDS